MPDICQLPTSVTNKIAAGEVIERPASVVKELLENSLDAGATRIDVAIEGGGAELIQITDNGCGVVAEQLSLAVASHATSKISDADDLFCVKTFGFRGEALASIASVSRLTLRSRTADAEAGAELEIVGGRSEPLQPVGCPQGTSVSVRQLFFNTPVRQKFLKKPQTEMGHITEAVVRQALAHPEVHFALTHRGRLVYDLPPVEDLRDRISMLFGPPIAENLISILSNDGPLHLSGYVVNPTQSRANNRLQYLFLNGRAIRDRSLQHALGEAYRGLLLSGRYPICFLRLDVEPSTVDVNVHPTKLEVRFQDAGSIYSQLLGTLRKKFLSTDLVARASVPEQPATEIGDEETYARAPAGSALLDWANRQFSSNPSSSPGAPPQPTWPPEVTTSQGYPGESLRLHDVPAPLPAAGSEALQQVGSSSPEQPSDQFLRVDSPVQEVPEGHLRPRALQIHNRYLVVENDQGLEVIDQHALHERILYEALREKVLSETIESQRLLVPEPVDLAASEAAAVLEQRELLSRLGVEIEPFGGETVLVSAYPAMLANFSPCDVVHSLAEKLQSEGQQPEARDLLDELLHMISCKAAVKFGDRLSPEEVDALLTQRHLAQDHHHCPHGRPTALLFTREQLDRQFKRI